MRALRMKRTKRRLTYKVWVKRRGKHTWRIKSGFSRLERASKRNSENFKKKWNRKPWKRSAMRQMKLNRCMSLGHWPTPSRFHGMLQRITIPQLQATISIWLRKWLLMSIPWTCLFKSTKSFVALEVQKKTYFWFPISCLIQFTMS